MPLSRYLAILSISPFFAPANSPPRDERSISKEMLIFHIMNQHLRWASSPGESGVRVLNIRVPSHYTSTISKCQSQFSFYTSVEHSHQLHRRRCVRQVVSLPQLDPQEDLKVHILRTLIIIYLCIHAFI